MILTRPELSAVLTRGHVPAFVHSVFVQSLQGMSFGTVHREWVAATWAAWVQSLRDNAPSLVEVRQLGGGRTQLVPKYFLNGFNCRGHGLLCYAHGMTGYALKASLARETLDHDSLAWGFLHYTASPRADNLNRGGRHENLWWIDTDSGEFETWEPADGEENEMTPDELGSITFMYAQ